MRKFVLIFIALSQWLTIAQETNEYSESCGKLNENYLYNFNSTAAVDEIPWIGRVYYEDSTYIHGTNLSHNMYGCLAVLISNRHLLLPANCIAKTSTDNHELYAVILGADNQCYRNNTCPSPVPNYYEIDEIALHPNLTFDVYNIIVDNDIGIITLKTDVSYNAEVSPICLPSKEDSSAHFVGQNLQYAGYAKNFVQPLKAVARVASNQKCRDVYRRVSLGDSIMCAIPDRKDQKYFLAGSPLMGVATKGLPAHSHNFYVIGLVALRIGYIEDLTYNVVSIGHHIEWIRFNIE